jgi:hypothetical protein
MRLTIDQHNRTETESSKTNHVRKSQCTEFIQTQTYPVSNSINTITEMDTKKLNVEDQDSMESIIVTKIFTSAASIFIR